MVENNTRNYDHIRFLNDIIENNKELWKQADEAYHYTDKNYFMKNRSSFWRKGFETLRLQQKDGVFNDMRHSTGSTAHEYALMALMAYDDVGYLLYSSADELILLSKLGHPYALYFIPATSIFAKIKNAKESVL